MTLRDIIDKIGIEPYYEEPSGVIYCGDCLEVMKQIPDGVVDLVLTDIPYGEVNRFAQKQGGLRDLNKGDADVVTFSLEELLVGLCCVGNGSWYIFCGTGQVSAVRSALAYSGLMTRHGFWEKDNPSPMNGQHTYLSAIENIIFAKAPNALFNGFCKKPVWRSPVVNDQLHPTQKPLSIISDMITTSSKETDLILDPFLGSGTTAVAAKQLGRKFIGIESSEEYCEIAKQRLAQEELF